MHERVHKNGLENILQFLSGHGEAICHNPRIVLEITGIASMHHV